MSKNDDSEKKAPAQKDYQSVCGIDALYFYVKVDFNHYSRFYINNLLKNHLESDIFVLLSKDYSNQFTYFNHFGEIKRKDEKENKFHHEGFSPIQKICRIGFKNLNENDNLDSIIVQMDSNILQQFKLLDIQNYFVDILNNIGLKPIKFQLSRVDLNTHIFNYSFDWLDYDYFSTKLKKNKPHKNGSVLETFELGSRTNSLMLRIYDKIKQLRTLEWDESNLKEHLINLKYKRKYCSIPDYSTLWNVELEIRREQLKLFNIDTLEDLDKRINSLFFIIFTKTIRLLEKKKKYHGNDNRIENHSVWNHILEEYNYNSFPVVELEKDKLKEYKRDVSWLKNRLNEFLEEQKNNDVQIRYKVSELIYFLDKNVSLEVLR
jgi:hypothetical protein